MSNRELIYSKTGGKCYYCGCDLPKRWHADHLIPLRRGDKDVEHMKRFDVLENKVPSCPRCNLRKSTFNIEQFRKEIQSQVERLKKYSNQFNLALDYGLVEITDKEVEFYFETNNVEIVE